MKKKLFLLLSALIFTFFSLNVYADDCSYTEEYALMQEAAKVKVKYATKDHFVPADGCAGMDECSDVKERYFEIYILNLSENFYIEATNSITNEKVTYTYDDVENGTITIIDKNVYDIKSYTFNIYASVKTSCYSKKMTTQYLSLPRYNQFYGEDFCSENPEMDLCEEYVQFKDIDYEKFLEKAVEYKDSNNTTVEQTKSWLSNIIDFIINNIVWVITSVCLLASLITGYVIIRKRSAK